MQSSKNTLSSLWQKLFGDPIRAFGVVSLLLLISLAIAPAKNHFSEWHHYQKQYLAMIRGRGEAVTLQRHLQEGIQQIWLPDLGVVDRCTTCHVGLNEASLADVSAQPFRRHPVIPHRIDQFGCVMCHRGQGRQPRWKKLTAVRWLGSSRVCPRAMSNPRAGNVITLRWRAHPS